MSGEAEARIKDVPERDLADCYMGHEDDNPNAGWGSIKPTQAAKPYYYIGKDGKTVLARDLEDQRDALASDNAALLGKMALRDGECEAKAAIIAQLEAQLATVRDEALEEAAKVAFDGLSIEWEYVCQWTEGYEAARQDIAEEIRALKGSTS